MKPWEKWSLTLAGVGAANWGLVSLFGVDLVKLLEPIHKLIPTALYIVIAAAGVKAIYDVWFRKG